MDAESVAERAVAEGVLEWEEFGRRYKEEPFEESRMDVQNNRIKNYGQKFTLRLIKELTRRQPVMLICS